MADRLYARNICLRLTGFRQARVLLTAAGVVLLGAGGSSPAWGQSPPVGPGCDPGEWVIRVGETVEGTLDRVADRLPTGRAGHRFCVEPAGWAGFSVHLTSSDFDTYLVLVSPDGDLLVNDDYEGSTAESRLEGLQAPDTTESPWRVWVTTFPEGESGRYRLEIRAAEPRPGGAHPPAPPPPSAPPPSGAAIGGVDGPRSETQWIQPREAIRHTVVFRAHEPAVVLLQGSLPSSVLELSVWSVEDELIGRTRVTGTTMESIEWVPDRTAAARIEVHSLSPGAVMYNLTIN